MRRFLRDLARLKDCARWDRRPLAALFHDMVDRECRERIRRSMEARPAVSECPFCRQMTAPDHVCVKPEDREGAEGRVERVTRP
jgi:ribosomal protein L32